MSQKTRSDKGTVCRTIWSAIFLLLLGFPGLADGGWSVDHPPVITGVDADPLVSRPENAVYGMTIYGQNFWLSGPNDPNRRVFLVRRQNQPFRTVLIQSISNTVMNVEFTTHPLLNGAGTLEFMVKIDGLSSNTFAVQIVADPPRLDSITPAQITRGGAADDPRWKVWLRGSRWITPTSIWINGVTVGTCFQNQNSGQEHFTWPPSLRQAGRYSVQLRTVHGASETRTVDVVTPPPSPTATKKALGTVIIAKPDPTIRASVDSPPSGFIGTFDKTPPNYQPLWIYGIRPNGELIWYHKDSNASAWQGPKTVGTGWNSFKDVIPAGGNRFYALTQDAKLIWYRHDGFNEGSFVWPGPVEVGSGWTFSRIFSGGQGIVYAIKSDGTLLWYKNNDSANGLRSWQEAKVVGSAWNQFKDVFSTGQGAIYAVRNDGRLSLYQHDGYATGEAKWQQDRVVGTGWNSFKQIIPSSDGVIMGILPDGKLIWHKHLGFTHPSTSSGAVTARIVKEQETWEGPVQIGSGWQDFGKVIALIPDPPAVVR